MIALLLACASEYAVDSVELPPAQWVRRYECPAARAVLGLPLEAEVGGVWWCAGDSCDPLAWIERGHLWLECPGAGEVRVLWIGT